MDEKQYDVTICEEEYIFINTENKHCSTNIIDRYTSVGIIELLSDSTLEEIDGIEGHECCLNKHCVIASECIVTKSMSIPHFIQTHPNKKMLVNQNYHVIQFLSEQDQTVELCKLAIKQNINALKFIKSKTDNLLEFAFQQNPSAIQYFDVQPHDKCLIAVRTHGYNIRLLKPENQTPDVCVAAVKENGNVIGFIKHLQTPELCMIALQNTHNRLYSMESIQHPTFEHFVEFCYKGGSYSSVPIEFKKQVEISVRTRTEQHLRAIAMETLASLRKRLCKPVHVGTQTI